MDETEEVKNQILFQQLFLSSLVFFSPSQSNS